MSDDTKKLLTDAFGADAHKPKLKDIDAQTILATLAYFLDRWLITMKDAESGSTCIKFYNLSVFAKSSKLLFGTGAFIEEIRAKHAELCEGDFDEWYNNL